MSVAMPEDLHLDLNPKTTRQEKEFLLLFQHSVLHLSLLSRSMRKQVSKREVFWVFYSTRT